jgi:hypothetical protein
LIRDAIHIVLAALVSLTPPGASMVQYTCDETGATTQIVSTLGAGNHVDECCDGEETASHAFTSLPDDCCRATVFSLPPTSPAPGQVTADAAPAPAPLDIVRPGPCTRLAALPASRALAPPVSRNFPLLV